MKKIGKIALIVLAIIVGLFILIMLIPTNDDTEANISPAKEESVVETQTTAIGRHTPKLVVVGMPLPLQA